MPKEDVIRPTKKQRELLSYIEEFIAAKGYSPSYREIMTALNYNSVATVALHIDNLIKRGHLEKRDHSARSLEVVDPKTRAAVKTNVVRPEQEKWLVEKITYFFDQAEQGAKTPQAKIDELYVLIGSLRILGLEGAAQSFIARLSEIKKKAGE